MNPTEETLTEMGEIVLAESRGIVVRVVLYQKLTQHVRFVYDCKQEPDDRKENLVPPLGLKEVRHLQRLLAKAQRKMQKAVKRMGK